MATNEWGMLRDIFTEIAGEQKTAADVLSPPFTATGQARRAAHYTVADAFRRAAETMTARGGMTPDELTAAVREVFPRPTKDVYVSDCAHGARRRQRRGRVRGEGSDDATH